jgi:uncharacterized membrane protein HdeD (DUF308 family)
LSNSTANPASFGAGDSPFSGITMKWGWFAALGILSIVAGFLALLDVVAFTIISVIFIGAMLLVSGIFQVVHAFATKTWRHFGINVVLGVLYVVGGLLIMREPVRGSLVITIFLLAALVVGGIMRIVIALRHRELRYWWLMAIGGVISVVIGILLWASLPWSSLVLLGTLIAFELIVMGVTWLQFGLALRRRYVQPTL